MKTLATLLLAIIVTTASAHADNAWGPVASYWDTADGTDGTGLGVFLALDAGNGVSVDFRYTWFEDLMEGAIGTDISDVDLEVTPCEFGISKMTKIGESLELYIGGGLGYYIMDGNVDRRGSREVSFDPDDEFGVYGLCGFRIIVADNMGEHVMARRVTIFGEAMYRMVSVDEITVAVDQSITVENGDLDGVGANLGIMLHW